MGGPLFLIFGQRPMACSAAAFSGFVDFSRSGISDKRNLRDLKVTQAEAAAGAPFTIAKSRVPSAVPIRMLTPIRMPSTTAQSRVMQAAAQIRPHPCTTGKTDGRCQAQ